MFDSKPNQSLFKNKTLGGPCPQKQKVCFDDDRVSISRTSWNSLKNRLLIKRKLIRHLKNKNLTEIGHNSKEKSELRGKINFLIGENTDLSSQLLTTTKGSNPLTPEYLRALETIEALKKKIEQ
jgi:hypothetical protein